MVTQKMLNGMRFGEMTIVHHEVEGAQCTSQLSTRSIPKLFSACSCFETVKKFRTAGATEVLQNVKTVTRYYTRQATLTPNGVISSPGDDTAAGKT